MRHQSGFGSVFTFLIKEALLPPFCAHCLTRGRHESHPMADVAPEVLKSLAILAPEHNTEANATALRVALTNAGFIVVREESRALSKDVAVKLGGGDELLGGSARLVVVAKVNATAALSAFVDAAPQWAIARVAADHETAAQRLLLLFPRMVVDPIPSNSAAREYCDRELKAILVRGLTECAKRKPDNAVAFIADYLLENNPRVPKVGA